METLRFNTPLTPEQITGKMFEPQKIVKPDIIPIQTSGPVIPYQQAKQQVNSILTKLLANQKRTPVWDTETIRLYRLLSMYWNNEPDFEKEYLQTSAGKIPYSLRKGLLLIGSTGRSKTFSFRVFNIFNKKFYPNQKTRLHTSVEIQNKYTEIGLSATYKFYNQNEQYNKEPYHYNMYIDELGVEETAVKNYGNTINPLITLLDERYRIFSEGNAKTHISTNLSLKDLKQKYGDRIYSRLFEMMNIIITEGNDLRIQFIL